MNGKMDGTEGWLNGEIYEYIHVMSHRDETKYGINYTYHVQFHYHNNKHMMRYHSTSILIF